jgi:hypothetical protein
VTTLAGLVEFGAAFNGRRLQRDPAANPPLQADR